MIDCQRCPHSADKQADCLHCLSDQLQNTDAEVERLQKEVEAQEMVIESYQERNAKLYVDYKRVIEHNTRMLMALDDIEEIMDRHKRG